MRFLVLLFISTLIASCTDIYSNPDIQDIDLSGVKITSSVDSIQKGSSFQMEAAYLDKYGNEMEVDLVWSCVLDTVISITDYGLMTGVNKGLAYVKVSFQDGYTSRGYVKAIRVY